MATPTSSIHFPVLKTLSLAVTRTDKILREIIAPILEQFVCNRWGEHKHIEVKPPFSDFERNFPSVRYFDIQGPYPSPFQVPLLCEVLPSVQHVELDLDNIDGLFSPLCPLATNNVAHPL